VAASNVKARVLLDDYSWHEKCNDPTTPMHTASKGDEITVSQAEFGRAQKMVPVGLAKASDKDTPAVGDAPPVPSDLSELSDAELKAIASARGATDVGNMTRDELVGVVSASPGGNERPTV
jgi:hypothetical protein